MKFNKKDIIGSKTELVIKETTVSQPNDGVVVISGYANRYLDENGKLVVDRSEESVLPQGYDLCDFMKNPILLYSHDKSQPIGKIINIDVRVDGLYIEAEVHKFMNEQVYYGVLNGILKTFSIGFMILDYAEVDGVYLWTQTKLLEISIVSVPDNQDSLFSVLTDAPCQTGVCLLGSKAISSETIKQKSLEAKTKDWVLVDKEKVKMHLSEIGREEDIKDAYLVVKDVSNQDTWKFPHHDFEHGSLILNKGGLNSAFSALKSVKDDDILSVEEKLAAAEHLKGHFEELLQDGLVEEAILENLTEFITGLKNQSEESTDMKTKEEGATQEQPEAEVTEAGQENETSEETTEQPAVETTINSSEETEEEEETQNPEENQEKSGEGNTNSDSSTVGMEAVEAFIGSAKQTPEGVEQLFVLYAELADTLNEVLSSNEED